MGSKNKNLDRKKLMFAYVPGNSLMHKLNPLSKLFFLLLLTILILLITSLLVFSVIFLFILIIALLSGISPKILFQKLRFVFMIMIVSVVLNIFFNAIPSEQEIILFYLFDLPFLPIRRLAVYYAFKALFIILILFTSSIIYTYTTNMRDFVYSLMRLKIPYRYCYAFMVGIRYIPLIEQEAKTISLAQRARGFGYEKVNSIKKAYSLIIERLIATLVSILRKGHTTSISMENRCFGIYKDRTNLVKIPFKFKDIFFMVLCGILFTMLILYIFNFTPLPPPPSLYNTYFQKGNVLNSLT
ncbi:MAG: energy-coupling factor transporter transmembrane component T family protein [Candidatus Hermodarchaeota archaeon]